MINAPAHERAPRAKPAVLVPARPIALPKLTLDGVWLLLPALGLFIMLNLQTIAPNDFWWHLRTGQLIAASGAIPNIDLFTFTRSGAPWVNQSWLTQVLLYALYHAGGEPLVIFSYAVTVTAGYLFLLRACILATGGRVRPAVIAVAGAAMLGLMSWVVRPQAVSFALFGLVVYLIAEHQAGRMSSLAWFPVCFALWSNLHGGFVFGLGLFILYTLATVASDVASRRPVAPVTRRLVVTAIISCIATGANPSGPLGIAQYVLGFFQNSATQNLNQEFQPLTLRDGDGMLFAAFGLVVLLALQWRPRRLRLYDLGVALVFGLFAMQSRRVLPWFGMAAAPTLAWLLAGDRAASPRATHGSALPNYLLAGLLAAAACLSLPWLRPNAPFLAPAQRSYSAAETTPVMAAQVLCSQGSNSRVFAEIGYASYLAWACPRAPFFMDTRFELYPRVMWDDYLAVSNGQFGWQETLHRYSVNRILARKHDQPVLVAAVKAAENWRVIYEDEYSVLAVAR